jgi:hypothetical protein
MQKLRLEPDDRRRAPRRAVQLYFNKYIDGSPYACEALELSTSGMLLRKISEPDVIRDAYAVEIGPEYALPEERLWLYATLAWSFGPYEAIGFVGPSRENRRRLVDLIDRSEPWEWTVADKGPTPKELAAQRRRQSDKMAGRPG